MGYSVVVGKSGCSAVRCFEQEPPQQVVKQPVAVSPPPIIAKTVMVASARVESTSPAQIDSQKHGSARRYNKSDGSIGQERRKCQHKHDRRQVEIYR